MDDAQQLAIDATGLRRCFGTFVAVDSVDLSVERGELVSLLGPNGAGKTTTIHMLCCLLRPTAGTAVVAGHDTQHDPIAVKQVIAVSPQETAVAEHLDAWENLSLMARLHGLGPGETRQRSERLLHMFGLEERADERAKKFSGGMKRRLSIAMALVSDPEILFLDEPTLGLDPQSRLGLWEHIKTLKGDTTIVLTTHYLEEADALADRIVVIDEGRVIAEGTSDELKTLVPQGQVTVVDADLTDAAVERLTTRFGPVKQRDGGAEILRSDVNLDDIVDVLRPLGITTRACYRQQVTLDDVFVHLTGKALRE